MDNFVLSSMRLGKKEGTYTLGVKLVKKEIQILIQLNQRNKKKMNLLMKTKFGKFYFKWQLP